MFLKKAIVDSDRAWDSLSSCVFVNHFGSMCQAHSAWKYKAKQIYIDW